MSIFGVDLRAIVGQVSSGQLPAAVTLTVVTDGAPAGDLIDGPSQSNVAYPCQGLMARKVRGALDGSTRAKLSKITLVGASLPESVTPKKDDIITIDGEQYQVLRCRVGGDRAAFFCDVQG